MADSADSTPSVAPGQRWCEKKPGSRCFKVLDRTVSPGIVVMNVNPNVSSTWAVQWDDWRDGVLDQIHDDRFGTEFELETSPDRD